MSIELQYSLKLLCRIGHFTQGYWVEFQMHASSHTHSRFLIAYVSKLNKDFFGKDVLIVDCIVEETVPNIQDKISLSLD